MAKPGAEAAPQAVPGFWDPRRRPDRPDLSRLTVIRFLTETDYPPFNFTGPDGNPAGFNVDLARLLCDEIKVTCTIQMRRFETLLDAITSNRGDAIIASLAVTPQLRARVDFTDPYYRAPARFVSRRDAVMAEVRPEYLEGKKVGVIAGSAHEAYLKAMFTDAELHSYPNDDALRLALRRGEVDFIFGDAISLAFWINGTDSGDCCAFSRRPVRREPLFRRRHRHRRAQGQRPVAAGAELGAVPGLGKRPLHRSVAALFFGQSVLSSFRHCEVRKRSNPVLACAVLDCFASLAMTAILRECASFRGLRRPFLMSTIDLPPARATCARSPNNPTPGRSSRRRRSSRG